MSLPPDPVVCTLGNAQSGQKPSPFRRALDEYVRSRRPKSKTPTFLQELQAPGRLGTKEDVQKAMLELERTSTDKTSARAVRIALKPVIRVLADYSGVIDTLAQADPMPTAVIWGCLKTVVNSSKRFLKLYEIIEEQLDRLSRHLECLTAYEELFGDSALMQELLEASYINVIRFWRRVDKECNRCVVNRMGRALASFSTSKLDGIIKSIDQNSSDISKLIPIVQERLLRGEREDAAVERRSAGIARDEQSAFFKQEQEQRKRDLKVSRQKDVRQWLRGSSTTLNESNDRHHDQCVRQRNPHTCSWLSSHTVFQDWLQPSTNASRLWLRAARGVGKSVLCAYAIQQSLQSPSCCSIRQYYTFDEEFTAVQVYRSLAEQLADQVISKSAEIPVEVHEYTQRSATSSKCEDVKNVIRLLLREVPTTFVFLDGLDEECDDKKRWRELVEVIDFFEGLTTADSSRIRLWCSSQDRADIRRKLDSFEMIEVSKALNQQDIETCLAERILDLESDELDPGYRTLILADLLGKADGRFLWASLMLDLIADAATLQSVQQQIQQGLPEDYERYYYRKLENLDGPQKRLISIILACIVCARRPLKLDELCEATAMMSTDLGKNLDKSQSPFKSRIPRLCEPLLQIQEVSSAQRVFTTCTLSHSSVRDFLVSNPQVLSDAPGVGAYRIDNNALANVCLKYLSQRRYCRLLHERGDTFVDLNDEDFLEHHLLSYAAKYWDKHLDDVPSSQEMCQQVEKFVTSPQFVTCLQVQSLVIEGQFSFWTSPGKLWQGPHLRRAFPHWFANGSGEKLSRDYYSFAGEWGHFLNDSTSYQGSEPGQIDRCFWGALGERNYLHKVLQSRFKSFKLETPDSIASNVPLSRCYDTVEASGEHLLAVRLANRDDADECLAFVCELWDLSRRRPKVQHLQTITVPRLKWDSYDCPSLKKCFGRPIPVSLTPDLRCFRIGAVLFTKSEDGTYHQLDVLGDEEYFEDIASRGDFLAIACRQSLSEENLMLAMSTTFMRHEDILAEYLEKAIEAETEASKSTTQESEHKSDFTRSANSASSSNTSLESLSNASSPERNKGKTNTVPVDVAESTTADPEFWEAESSTDSLANSAETFWSDGSTTVSSDNLEDGDQWNDWGNERLLLDELNEKADYDESSDTEDDSDDDEQSRSSSPDSPSSGQSVLSNSTDANGLAVPSLGIHLKAKLIDDSESTESSESSKSILSHYSQSLYSTSGDESHSDNEHAGEVLNDLLFGRRDTDKSKGTRISIRIFNNMNKHKKPIFHFSQWTIGQLYSSPPTFHPSRPLLVWPLGAGEILFANYQNNTYFTRVLCSSGFGSCQVFVKSHFSSNGEYLHFAALEVQPAESSQESDSKKPGQLLLTLQVSTHRLSTHKTEWSPPNLVARSSVSLNKTHSIEVSTIPYTLTWTDQYLYFVERDTKLNLVRVPLFRSGTAGDKTIVCRPRNDIHLPRTAASRDVHYFPPQEHAKKGKEGLGTIIIGSYSSLPAQGVLVPRHAVSPPIGVLVSEEDDLGGWVCREEAVSSAQRQNIAGGRLQGKFERFDLKEDCDIVPYLA